MPPQVYSDLFAWIQEHGSRLMKDVVTDIDNKAKRQQWAKEADMELTRLCAKWGKP